MIFYKPDSNQMVFWQTDRDLISCLRLQVQCRYIGTTVEALVIEVGLVPPPPPVAAPGPLRVELRLANGQCNVKGCVEGWYEGDILWLFSLGSDSGTKLIFLLEQRTWPTAPFTRTPTTPSQRCSGIPCTLRSECWRGLIQTLSWLLEDAGQLLAPTLIVFLSGTCWLMGKCWSDVAVIFYDFYWCYTQSLFLSSCHSCPYRDDRYLTALVPVGPSSGLLYPTHHRRFIFKMFTFVATGNANTAKGGFADPEVMTPLKEKV